MAEESVSDVELGAKKTHSKRCGTQENRLLSFLASRTVDSVWSFVQPLAAKLTHREYRNPYDNVHHA